MKVLVLSPWYPSHKKPNSGIFVKEISLALKNEGIEIELIHFTTSPSNKFFEKNVSRESKHGISIHRINISSLFWRAFWHSPKLYFSSCKKQLYRIVERFNPDLIHCHVVFPTGIFAHRLSSHFNRPYMITEHWSRIDGFLSEHPSKRGAIRAYLSASKVVAVSEFLSEKIEDHLHGLDIEIIGNVVDEGTYYYKPKEPVNGHLKFTMVSSWNHQRNVTKRPDIVLKALHEVQKQIDRELKLEIIGGGTRMEELKELARDLGIQTRFAGYQSKDYINRKLQQSHFFLHGSQIETFGIVCIEALLTGTPVIASNTGALKEWINAENGLLTENSVEAWKKAILNALEISFDHKKISEQLRGRFNATRIASDYKRIFKEVTTG